MCAMKNGNSAYLLESQLESNRVCYFRIDELDKLFYARGLLRQKL